MLLSSTKIKRGFVWVAPLLILSFLGACSAHRQPQLSQQAMQACQTNEVLLKYQCSLKAVEQAAQKSDADAEYALGYMYYYGINTRENVESAQLWMRRAAAQGQPQAMEALRLLQSSGDAAPTAASHKPAAKAVKKASRSTPPATEVSVSLDRSYSIQLAATVNLPRLQEFVVVHHLKGKAGYYKTCIDGKIWYILIYGHYASRTAAMQALKQLPSALQKLQPWVKSYKTISQQVEKAKSC